ncbi:MAG: hypothetical protein ACKO13_10590, partial [Cytophagales bacterium]
MLVPASLLAQNQKYIDSLRNRLNANLPDSLKVTTLIELSKKYQYTDIAKSKAYSQQAIELSESKNLKWAKVKSYLNAASFHSIQGDYGTALRFVNMALGFSYERADSLQISICYINLGTYSNALGRFDEGYYYHTQAYRIAVAAKKELQQA